MCLACLGAQYACRNWLQLYVATYMHMTSLRALGKNIKIIAMPACERGCNINLHQRIGITRVSCKCVWLAMERNMLAAIGFSFILQHTCT